MCNVFCFFDFDSSALKSIWELLSRIDFAGLSSLKFYLSRGYFGDIIIFCICKKIIEVMKNIKKLEIL